MTPDDFRAIRIGAGLSLAQLAQILRISDKTTVHRWERGDRAISGQVAMIMEMIAAGELPDRYFSGVTTHGPISANA